MPAYYRGALSEFLADDPKRILGVLTAASENSGFLDLKHRQVKAWQREIELLRTAFSPLLIADQSRAEWAILLEYPIPRRAKRIDAVLLARDVIFCIEFKTEDKKHSRPAEKQAEDYALDLRDFHEQSRGRRIIPLVVATKAPSMGPTSLPDHWPDAVRPVWRSNGVDLGPMISTAFQAESISGNSCIAAEAWDLSAYWPVPTIIEAAESLFAGHDVREIAHSHAGDNLTVTSEKIVEIIRRAQRDQLKIACFVTGVPGAGKTLAGLKIVHNPILRQDARPPAVFLSGNGPLVRVVSKAIERDAKKHQRTDSAHRTVSTFIQNVHAVVRYAMEKSDEPLVEHVVVFDEAQRAWNSAQNSKKMGHEASEPQIVLSILDRHPDWAVLVALVGGGQEIHDGEAGLAEWGRTLRKGFPHWHVAASPSVLKGDTSIAGHRLFEDANSGSVTVQLEPALHLEVCLRSFRAQRVTEWVEAMLGLNPKRAADIIADIAEFPLVFTRSLATMRAWLREHTRGFRRCGLVASSGATRLRRYGLELSSGFRQGNRDLYVHWFLDHAPDVRSSNQLEVAASEFECQGLELDWIGVCWGGDFVYDSVANNWSYRRFSGRGWGNVKNEIDRNYLLNTYRVLLSRAREGLVIWVPLGDATDPTMPPDWFDPTAEYLRRCGLREI